MNDFSRVNVEKREEMIAEKKRLQDSKVALIKCGEQFSFYFNDIITALNEINERAYTNEDIGEDTIKYQLSSFDSVNVDGYLEVPVILIWGGVDYETISIVVDYESNLQYADPIYSSHYNNISEEDYKTEMLKAYKKYLDLLIL